METLIINTIKINEKEVGENQSRYAQKSVKNMNNSLLEMYMDTNCNDGRYHHIPEHLDPHAILDKQKLMTTSSEDWIC